MKRWMLGIFIGMLVCSLAGCAEVVRSPQEIEKAYEDLNEDAFGSMMYSADVPDPDLIIRPSGELRTSNFLLWQSAYSEYYFTDVLWPDYTPEDLEEAIAAFNKRKRRFGGV